MSVVIQYIPAVLIGYFPSCAIYACIALRELLAAFMIAVLLALSDIPLYATIDIVARIAITTMTMRSSTIVKPRRVRGDDGSGDGGRDDGSDSEESGEEEEGFLAFKRERGRERGSLLFQRFVS